MMRLYHNGMSSCSQKVRLVLAEKHVQCEMREINLIAGEQRSPDYLAINPRGLVPVLLHDDAKIFESSVISEYVEEAFPGPTLMPRAPLERAAARQWMKFIDDHVHQAVGILLFATAQRAFLMARPESEVLVELERIPSASQRQLRTSVFKNGLEAAECSDAMRTLTQFVSQAGAALNEREFFAGRDLSLADCAVSPYLLRLQHLGLETLWVRDANGACVTRWLSAMRSRASAAIAIDAFLHEPALALMRATGASLIPAFENLPQQTH